MKPTVLNTWIEIDDKFLGPDKGPPGWEAYIFCTKVSKHKGPKSGKVTVHRRKFLFTATGKTKKETLQKIADFIDKEKAIIITK